MAPDVSILLKIFTHRLQRLSDVAFEGETWQHVFFDDRPQPKPRSMLQSGNVHPRICQQIQECSREKTSRAVGSDNGIPSPRDRGIDDQ